jgi:hypothetical protein
MPVQWIQLRRRCRPPALLALGWGVSAAACPKSHPTAPSITSIVITPGTVSLHPGQQVTFFAYGRNSNGDSVAAPVTYSATGGVISTGGLYTADTTAGTFHVIAVATGGVLADTATVVIAAAGPSAAECANPQPGWIWCDDFEQDRLSSYFEIDNAGGNFTRAAGVGKDGSYGMRAHFPAGAIDGGALHVAFGKTPGSYFKPVDAGTATYREIYWRMYVRTQPGWVGGAHDKLSRALVFAEANFSEAALAHVWGSSSAGDTNNLLLDPASGTDTVGVLQTVGYNDFAHLRFLGQVHTSRPIFDAAHVGQWYCVEAHAKLNDAGSSNGVFELWIDDTLAAQVTALNWLGAYSAFGFNAVYFENYWNNGAAVAEDRFFDNIVVSTQRIGC